MPSDDYRSTEETFADAEDRRELAADILKRSTPAMEGDAGWIYATKIRKLPADAVRAALPELRIVAPPIPGRHASDYALMSLLRKPGDREDSDDGEDSDGCEDPITGFQLTFIKHNGAPSTVGLKRQTYNLVENGCRDALFHAGGGEGERAFVTEGYLEKAIAVASLGRGPVYGAGSRSILGTTPPPEKEVTLVADRKPRGKTADPKTGMLPGDLHDRDMKRAVDLLRLTGKEVARTTDPPACKHSGKSACKDADDVLVRHGPVALEDWLDKAEVVGLSLDGEARRIARIICDLERAEAVKEAAKRLGLPIGDIRKAVHRHRDREGEAADEDDGTGHTVTFDEVEAAADPQDGAQLLNDLDAAIARHAFVDRHARTKAVLWTVHNHRRFHRNISMLPRLVITAPTEDSGKSSLAEVVILLNDIMAYLSDPSPSSVFRKIEESFCGWVLDEVDSWYGLLDVMRKIINSGSDERAKIHRVEDTGTGSKRKLEVREYSPYAPMVFAGLKLDKLLRRTTLSRALIIKMQPARVGEVIEDIQGNRAAAARLRTLAGRVKRWVADNETALSVADPDLPSEVINRLRQVWRPLLAIADQAGGGWRERALAALQDARDEGVDPNLGEQLLLDMRDVIREHGREVRGDRVMHATDLVAQLVLLEERQWSVFGKRRDAICDFEIRDLVQPFGLKPDQIQIGGRGGLNRRGYRLSEVDVAVERYVHSPEEPKTAARPLDGGLSPCSAEEIRQAKPCEEDLPDAGFAGRKIEPDQGDKPRSSGLAAENGTSGESNTVEAENGAAETPPRVGDRVQWTSYDGVDQLPGGGTVTAISDDGQFLWIDGSQTGIPVVEVTVLGRSPHGVCVDCGATVQKPARGPIAKRCPECRPKRGRPVVEPGIVFT